MTRLGRSRKSFEIMCVQFHKIWYSENDVDFLFCKQWSIS